MEEQQQQQQIPLSHGSSGQNQNSISIPSALFHPNMMNENLPNSDPLSTLISKHLPHPRPPRDLSGHLNVPTLESFDIKDAIQQGHWRKVATFSRLSILSFNNLNDPKIQSLSSQERLSNILQYWSLRFIALVRLRLHGLVEEEVNRLWDVLSSQNDHVIENGNGNSLLDSPLIPFELHIIRARSPRNCNSDISGTIDRLWDILRGCKTREREARLLEKRLLKQKQNFDGQSDLDDRIGESVEIRKTWKDRKDRTRLLIAGYMAEMKDYSSCVSILDPLIKKSSDPQVLSLISRLHLQAGSLSTSSKLIQRAKIISEERISEIERLLNSSDQSEEVAGSLQVELLSLKNLIITNEALLLISMGRFKDAKGILSAFEENNRDSIVREGGGNLTSLLNNLAITMFYSGELEKPLEILEMLLKESPSQVTSAESLIFNLTTFHELRREDSIRDKVRILTLVAQWAGEGISSSSLKLA